MKNITDFFRLRLFAKAFICTFLLTAIGVVNAETQPDNNTSPQLVKAFKTLNFGDDNKTVEKKLAELVGGQVSDGGISSLEHYSDWEALKSSFFDTAAECESQPDKYGEVMHYINETGINTDRSCQNSAISVTCCLLNKTWNTRKNGELAIVEASYKTFDLDKLVEGFKQNYPNARKDKRAYRIESEKYRGISIEFERAYLSDINPDRRARLSIPTKKFSFTFTEPSKLPKEQLVLWEALMTADGKTSNIKEYFESVKNLFLELAKNMESKEKIDDYTLTVLGWPNDGVNCQSLIYGGPCAVFASKQILGLHMNNYLQATEGEKQKEKAKLKKESDSANGF